MAIRTELHISIIKVLSKLVQNSTPPTINSDKLAGMMNMLVPRIIDSNLISHVDKLLLISPLNLFQSLTWRGYIIQPSGQTGYYTTGQLGQVDFTLYVFLEIGRLEIIGSEVLRDGLYVYLYVYRLGMAYLVACINSVIR